MASCRQRYILIIYPPAEEAAALTAETAAARHILHELISIMTAEEAAARQRRRLPGTEDAAQKKTRPEHSRIGARNASSIAEAVEFVAIAVQLYSSVPWY